MDMKARIMWQLCRLTSDKKELNRIVLKLKKRFEEAGAVLHDKKRKQP